jgi:murein DD-endopeptidase MepM/ murein hydrolase activator NlpD
VIAAAVAASSVAAQEIPALPDSSGWGVHVLALAKGPDSSIWVGTYGQGIFRLSPRATIWDHVTHSNDTAAHSISWDFVHAFAFGPRGQIWYGTVGNGWGLSVDGGKTWKNWEYRELGPEWQYVAPNGIVTRGDTTYIATADGIKVTSDDGRSWAVITDSMGAATTKDSVLGRIRSQYVLRVDPIPTGSILIEDLDGMELSKTGGRTWESPAGGSCPRAGCAGRGPRLRPAPGDSDLPGLSVSRGCRACPESRFYDITAALGLGHGRALLGTAGGLIVAPDQHVPPEPDATLAQPPTSPRHTWFRRPIAASDQPYIDQTYRFGSTMGGNFQPHQGVEFNNPDGTPVHAIGDGIVVYSGPAEAGANTIAIRHDRKLNTADGERLVFSVYYHNSKLLAQVGQRVGVGDMIALVGNTGRATNDHLHLEVHVAPTTDSSKIVDPSVRYPPYNANPELWIEPLPGTGLLAGQAWDSRGQPVPQARIYGLVKPEPQETPFSFIEAYGPRNHADPVYHEHFAVSDVPAGEYVLGMEIEGRRVSRWIRVAAGKLTWVEFRPDAH